MDAQKRYTNTNVELKAQGIGNIVSSLLGGLPMTSVVVRSSANNNAGAKTKMSAIITYIKDSFEELSNNVSWTPRQELQRLVVVVLVFSVLFSISIWGADTVLSKVVGFYFKLING